MFSAWVSTLKEKGNDMSQPPIPPHQPQYMPGPLEYATETLRPGVVTGFTCYAWLLVAMYGIVFVAGVFLAVAGGSSNQSDAIQAVIFGGILAVMGAVFATAFLVAIFKAPGPGLWVYRLVLICVGFTSICTLPFCIWMLVLWLRDDCKRFHGRAG